MSEKRPSKKRAKNRTAFDKSKWMESQQQHTLFASDTPEIAFDMSGAALAGNNVSALVTCATVSLAALLAKDSLCVFHQERLAADLVVGPNDEVDLTEEQLDREEEAAQKGVRVVYAADFVQSCAYANRVQEATRINLAKKKNNNSIAS
jgi:imidazolonepropionase-like amidohydrolase